jgi:thioredoxin 1
MSDKIQTLTDANWESEVLASPQPILVDFWAEWCKPCLAMAPDVEAVAELYDGRLRVGKLNVEENNDVPYKYNITGMPTLLLFKGGRVMEQRVGKLSKEALVKFVEPHL